MTVSRNRSIRTAFAALVLVAPVAPVAMAAHVAGTAQDRAIGVHVGRYVAGGQTYSTLEALEAAVRASHPAALLIVSCTPAATPAWLAAVPRFEHLPMHLDVSDGSSPVCDATLPVSASTVSGSALEPSVQQYWNRRMP